MPINKGFRGVQNKPYNNGLPVVAPCCPGCGQTYRQIKIGFNKSGSRKYKCQLCGKRYTPQGRGVYEAE